MTSKKRPVRPRLKNPECPFCDGRSFDWGHAQGHYKFTFKKHDGGLLEKATILGGQQLEARVCRRCGNTQFFTHKHSLATATELGDAAESVDATDGPAADG